MMVVFDGFATLGNWHSDRDVRFGVGWSSDARAGDARLQLHYALCPGEELHVIRLEEVVGGSRTPYAVPIYWQIESVAGSDRELYTVGEVPPGFVETIPLVRPLPTDDDLDITGTSAHRGTSFQLREVRADRVLRGDGVYVTPSQLHRDGDRMCRNARVWAPTIGFFTPILVGGMVADLRRFRRSDVRWPVRSLAVTFVAVPAAMHMAGFYDAVRHYDVVPWSFLVLGLYMSLGSFVLWLVLSPVLALVAAVLGWLSTRARLVARGVLALGIVGAAWVITDGRLGVFGLLAVMALAVPLAAVPLFGSRDAEAEPLRGLPGGWRALGAVSAVVAVWALVALGNVAEPARAATAVTRGASDPTADTPPGEIILDQPFDDSRPVETSFVKSGPYVYRIVCDGVAVQVSEGYDTGGSMSYGTRGVLPCNGAPITGNYADVKRGNIIHVFVDATGVRQGRLLVVRQ